MSGFVFNIAKGRNVELVTRINANDPTNSALVIVVLKAAGLQVDSVLKDHDTLASILAASNDEATNVNYARKILDQTGGLTITVNDTNDYVDVDMPDPVWASVGAAGGAWGKLLTCYDPDTTGGTDATIVPITAHDFIVTPDGTNITGTVATAGYYRSV